MYVLLVVFVVLLLIILGGAVALLALASQKTKCHHHNSPSKNSAPTPPLKGGEPLIVYPQGPIGAFIDTPDGYTTFNLFTLTIGEDPTTGVITSTFQRKDKNGNVVGNTIKLYVNPPNPTSSAPPFSVKGGWYDVALSNMLIYGNIEFEAEAAISFSPSVFDPASYNTLAKNRNDMSGVAWGTTAIGYDSSDPTKYCWYLGSFSPTTNTGAVDSKGTFPLGTIDVKPYPDVYATGISLDSSKNPLFSTMVALINPVVVGNPGSPDPLKIQNATTISILGLLFGAPLTSLANVSVSTSLPPSQLVVDGLNIYVVMVDEVNDCSQIARYTTNYVVDTNGFPIKGNSPQVDISLDKSFGTNGILITPAVVTDLKIVTSHWGSKKTNSEKNLCASCTNWKCFNVGMTAIVTSQVTSDGKVSIGIYKTATGTLFDMYVLATPTGFAPRELINVGITDRANVTSSRITTFGDVTHPTQYVSFPFQGTNMVNLISVALRTLQPSFSLQTLYSKLPYVAYGSDQTEVSGEFPAAAGPDGYDPCEGSVFCRSTSGGGAADPCCSKVPVFYGDLPPGANPSDYNSNNNCHWPMANNNPKSCPTGVDPNLCYDTLSICASINAEKTPDWTSQCPMVLHWTTDVTVYTGMRPILSFPPCYEARDFLSNQVITSYSSSFSTYTNVNLAPNYSAFNISYHIWPSQFASQGCLFVGPGTAWSTSPPPSRDNYDISFELSAFNNCEALYPYNVVGPAYLEYGLFYINNSIPVSNFLEGMAFGYVDGTTTKPCYFKQSYGHGPKLVGLDDMESFC